MTMKQLVPFTTAKDALTELDNGGRFYNILTDANDGEIEASELAKVAGVFNDQHIMFLYLDMVLSGLTEQDAANVIDSLSQELQEQYLIQKPQHHTPSSASKDGKAGTSAVITGIPKLIESKAAFSSFIMFPITANGITTFSMIPIFEQYDVYRVYDETSKQDFIIAHSHSTDKLQQTLTTFGGTLKELQDESQTKRHYKLFLEVIYYSF